MKENSIAEDIKMIEILKNKNLYINIKPKSSICIDCINKNKNKHIEAEVVINEKLEEAINYTLSAYKRVLKENEIYKKNSEIMSKENLSTAEQLKVEIKENFRLKNQLENNRKEYQETYKDVREELKKLKKENEELLQEKINNQKIIALAQNDMLNYQAGFEDGKNGRTSAVQSIIENQQYYIFQKQIEKYERHIEKLQKENEEFKKLHIQDNKHLDFIMKNSITIQKVKDKIEELQNGPLKINENNKYYYETEAYNKIIIQVLQELLEGRK